MRKLVVSLHSTANDIVTGPPSDRTNLDWARAGVEDSTEPLLTSMSTVDTILLGRATYEDLVTKWPLVEESPDEDAGARLAEKINATPKVVVTGGHPAGALEWGRFAPASPLAGADLEARIRGWKEGDGGDIITFGSPTLVQYLTNAGLVDEYHIIVHPVVVPEGQRLFDNLDARTELRLISAEALAHGAILVKYATLDG